MRKAQYFVVKHGGEWKIRAGYRYSPAYPGKREAISAAIDHAERDGQAGRDAQVLAQGDDRLFYTVWTYGTDPYPNLPGRELPRLPSERAPRAADHASALS
jgi:hypothetical protein